MLNNVFGRKIKSAVARFKGPSEGQTVRVDRDQLRTTLMQCEFEVRDMYKSLGVGPKSGSHRQTSPTCRY